MKNTAGGKPIAVLLQSISGVSVINPLAATHHNLEKYKKRKLPPVVCPYVCLDL
jgi:hypothetical protein